ncbi:MAG: type IX secretion system membrane protein PorP/SprF [Bacteroidales bacterium]|nr:type IX secretion system membrane protein PorP/SprF [Bacteroidales bacterium]
MTTNNRIKITVLFFLLIILVGNSMAQQNIQFTQYIFNSLSINPAYAGYKEQWYIQTTARTQWVGIEGAPQTMQLSVDGITNEENKRVGVGLQFAADKIGPQTATLLYANYAYRLQLDDEDTRRLSFGIAAGVTQYGLDESLLHPIDYSDPILSRDMNTNYIPDVRFGIYYYTPKWYLGFSVMDMLSGNLTSSIFHWDVADTANIIKKPHIYLMSGTVFDLTDYIKLRPGMLFKEDFNGPTCVDLNAMFIFGGKLWLGGSYRSGLNIFEKKFDDGLTLSKLNSVSGIIQLYISENIRLGYSYDYMINGLKYTQLGTHEITLGWTIPTKTQRLLSPRFF